MVYNQYTCITEFNVNSRFSIACMLHIIINSHDTNAIYTSTSIEIGP